MIRVTIELLPGGSETGKRVIGLMEMALISAPRLDGTADYAVSLKKSPPFSGALREAWKRGRVRSEDGALNAALAGEDDAVVVGLVTGHHRMRRGVYDLLFRGLKACGLHVRNPQQAAEAAHG